MPTHIQPPVIGIPTYGRSETDHFRQRAAYVDAVRMAGGVPVLLPPGEAEAGALITAVDGLMFVGGPDVSPELYNRSHHPSMDQATRDRDDFEIRLALAALDMGTPVLGICRGMQLLNVATGGDLYQHIPDEFGTALAHVAEGKQPVDHSVTIDLASRLAAIVGENEITVASKHHQGVRAVSDAWNIVAHAPDGMVEAVEHRAHPWMVAVQWHPELTVNDPAHLALFEALVDVAWSAKREV